MKQCSRCKQNKEKFKFRKGKETGVCCDCVNEDSRLWRIRNKKQRYCSDCGKTVGQRLKRCDKCKAKYNKKYLKQYAKAHREEVALRKRIWRLEKLSKVLDK